MFKPLQIVWFKSLRGVVTCVDGNFVTITWEDGSERRATAIQWRKSVKAEG